MRIFLASIFLIILSSCEKNIDINVNADEPKLSVDASIENGEFPIVVLTNSLSYFSSITPSAVANSFVRNATVQMSNGTVTQELRGYSFTLAPGFTTYFYSSDPAMPATAFKGALNTTYTLTINADGKQYTATTKILDFNATLDSMWVKQAPQNVDTLKRILLAKITDPPGRGNYVRYFTRVNSGPFLPGENSVYDDQVIDGTSFEAQISPGIDRNNPPKEEDNFFKKGDTIIIKFCNIDLASYKFWNTWEFAFQSIGNPFAQPNKVTGNISNNALGVFTGYACRTKTIIAK